MNSPRRPKFCRHCGAALPPGEPLFCIECGSDIFEPGALPNQLPTPLISAPVVASPPPPKATTRVPTVRLGNAGVEQSVIGGTMQLPTSGAIPPGLWVLDHAPGEQDTLAIYAPLRAVVDGWSGQTGKGWKLERSVDQPDGRAIFHFSAEVEWFPASGCGAGRRLRVKIGAESRGKEGRSRRGFRYMAHHDAPMHVIEARWFGERGELYELPIPQLQIMAPPRVPRVSDYEEQSIEIGALEGINWIKDSKLTKLYRLQRGGSEIIQEHTPVGRGITLLPIGRLESGLRNFLPHTMLGNEQEARFRLNIKNPYIINFHEWTPKLKQIRAEAKALGLDLAADPAAEWWLDRYGYDGVVLEGAQSKYGTEQAIIAFRRSQIARITG